MRIEISEKQKTTLVNAELTIKLLSDEQNLPPSTRQILRGTFIAMREVFHEVGIARSMNDNGFVRKKDGDHQWPIDNRQKWEALK